MSHSSILSMHLSGLSLFSLPLFCTQHIVILDKAEPSLSHKNVDMTNIISLKVYTHCRFSKKSAQIKNTVIETNRKIMAED